MAFSRFTLVALLSVLVATHATGQEAGVVPDPAREEPCRQCGMIFDIKPITTEREFARTFEEETPPAGPFVNIPLTKKPDAQAEIGVYGSRKIRKQMVETEYEVVVRYDDDRFTLIRVRDIANLRVGDRVRVNQNRIELID
ncbi:MAG: hypothetical protein JSU95_00905 [Betaproteobacteria bacterium]|nr:MAG: hypothetical protein JSU95_00905 [Betaproteobacteria bacterium]